MIRRTSYKELSAGMMRNVCNLYEAVSESDGEGGSIVIYEPIGINIPCLIDQRETSRRLEELQVSYDKSARVYMRFREVLNTNKIEIGFDMYTVHSVTNLDNRDKWIEILCYV